MPSSRFLAQVAVPLFLVLSANAESHSIKFVNQCGHGSPALMYNGQNILTSDTYTSDGPFSGIAYLQTGEPPSVLSEANFPFKYNVHLWLGYCNTNGENCTLLETTLINPACAGCGSSTDISLIPPHQYSVETSFAYYNGCDGHGKTCSSPGCTSTAFFTPTDYYAQVECEIDNVNLLVAFCGDASQFVAGGGSTTSGESTPTNTLPTSSSAPGTSSGSPPTSAPPVAPSVPGSRSSSTPSVTPTTTAAPTKVLDNMSTTPSSMPTFTPAPTLSSSDSPDPECEDDGETTPSSMPTPTSIATPSGDDSSDPGCEETGQTTPSLTPTPTPTQIATPSGGDSGCEGTGETTPPLLPSGVPTTSTPESVPAQQTTPSSPTQTPSTPTLSPTSTPTTSRRCRPRPTSLTPSVSSPTRPANTDMTAPTLSFKPTTYPVPSSGSAGTGAGTPDSCDDGVTGITASTPPAQRRRHRRTNHVHY